MLTLANLQAIKGTVGCSYTTKCLNKSQYERDQCSVSYVIMAIHNTSYVILHSKDNIPSLSEYTGFQSDHPTNYSKFMLNVYIECVE